MIEAAVVILIYMAPTVIAACREHHNVGGIAAINLLLGWTVVGWVVALIMALAEVKPLAPGGLPLRACPMCAELILPAAKLCKHCGSELAPQSGVVSTPDPKSAGERRMEQYGITYNGAQYCYGLERFDTAQEAILCARRDAGLE